MVAGLIIRGSIHKIEWDVLIVMMVVYCIVKLLLSILNVRGKGIGTKVLN